MTTQQEIEPNDSKDEKTKNSLFQTEISNPIISMSSENPDEIVNNKNNNSENENINSNETEKIKSNQNQSETEKIKSNQNQSENIAQDATTISTNDNDTKENNNEEKSDINSAQNNDPDQENKDIDLPQVTISINDQLLKGSDSNEIPDANENPDSNEIPDSNKNPDSNNDQSSLQSKTDENRTKTSNTNRNKNKNKKYSYLQEMNYIPDIIKYNKYISSRYELYTGNQKPVKIPKAAMSKKEYNTKEISKLDDLTQKLLDGDEETIKKIKNTRKINPNLNAPKKKNNENRQIVTNNTNNKNEGIDNNFNANDDSKEIENDGNNDNETKNDENNDNDDNEAKNDQISNDQVNNQNSEQNSINDENKTDEDHDNNIEDDNNIEEDRENTQIEEEEANDEAQNEEDNDLPTIEDLKRTAGQLREYEREMTNRGKYADAKKATLTLQMVNKEIYKQQNFAKNKGNIEDLVSKRNELKALLNSTIEEFDNMITDHEKNTISKLDQIALQQQQELEEFDKNIPNDLPPLFKRNSVAYLKMRSKEKYLAITRDFDEAMMLQKKADIVEKEEEQMNFEKMDQYYREKRKRLIIKQQQSVESYIQYSNMRKNEILNLKEVAIRGTTNRIKNLESQIRIECNKRGIKQSEINYDLVDESRIELIKSKENQNPISYKRAATSKCQRNSQTQQLPASKLSKRNSTTSSQSSVASRSSLSAQRPKIKTPSYSSYSPLSSSVGSKKRPTKPKKTAILNNNNNNKNKQMIQLNKNLQENPEEEVNNKSEIGVNTKLEEQLNENIESLNSEEK